MSVATSAAATDLAQILSRRAAETPDARAVTFLLDGEQSEETLTYAELHARARTLARQLRETLEPGARVLLLLPPGLGYLEAAFGCFYAGVIGVAAAPPQPKRLHRTLPRLLAIAADAEVKGVLTTPEMKDGAKALVGDGPLSRADWFCAEPASPEDAGWELPHTSPGDLAFLQYTSGSTAQPRGVALTHGNLMSNIDVIARRFGVTEESRGLSWLPPYHDMGLIGGIFMPIHRGFHVIAMSPMTVIKRPQRWLEAVSRHRATISGGPNFAYDMCVQRIDPALCEGMDLSTWETAVNGAEPIRPSTIESFCEAFAPYGFRRSAFLPSYGLAEATLLVTGTKREDGPVLRRFDDATLVGCGEPAEDHELVIVDPATQIRRAPGQVGEVWVSGPSVARGYWGDEAATARQFGARIAGEPDGATWLRTGDLGVIDDGELFITGRIKELLILHGSNVHPHDLEALAEDAHASVRHHCCAAFSLEEDGETRAAMVLEIDDTMDVDLMDVVHAVRRAVAAGAEVQLHRVAIVARGSVPKTTSGKIQRTLTREMLLAGELEPQIDWRSGGAG